jgi:pyruvate dehydrogenase E2 component (dihydrolipoamide acetyltransferase)
MSRFEFKLPDIGEGVSEGEIVSWLVHDGDAVQEGQDMVEVMTDKATVTIGAPKNGKVGEIRAKEGDTVPVGSVLVVLELDGATDAPPPQAKSAGKAQPPAPAKAPEKKADAPAEKAKTPAKAPPAKDAGPTASAVGDLKDVLPGVPRAPRIEHREPDAQDAQDTGEDDYHNDKPLAAPATRKLARELGVDLRIVKPTGEGGRVTREDIERSASGGRPNGPHSAQTMRPAPDTAPDSDAGPVVLKAPAAPSPVAPQTGEQRIPIRGLRKRIYENMARAKRTAAHFTYVDECNVTELKGVRERSKGLTKDAGVTVTFLPFIVKAVVASLKKHPTLNCVVDDSTLEMVIRKTYDIGIAVATDAGLTVPVLRGADRLSVLDIARELDRLGTEARAGKTRREDLGGSSFTITSLGKQGGLFATPVVNYPEVAILGVHQIKKRPVIKDDQIVIGDVMLLSLSFDHRIIDGHIGAGFAQEVIGYLETPERLLLEM